MEEAVNGNDLAWLFQEAVLNLKRNANEVLARLLLAIHHRFHFHPVLQLSCLRG